MDHPMTRHEYVTALKARVTPEFLATLRDLVLCDIYLGDYMEIESFVDACYALAETPCPAYRPHYRFTDDQP